MNNKTFLTIHAVIYSIFAFVLFFLPDLMWPVYGVELNDRYAYFLSQHNCIFLGGIGAITWLMRDIDSNLLTKKLFSALLVTNLLGATITLYAALTGIFTGFGWSDPIFFTVLSLLSYLQMKKQ